MTSSYVAKVSAVQSAAQPTRLPAWRTWIIAGRLPTLTAAIIPVLVGSAAAYFHGFFRPHIMAPTLLSAVLIQLGTNLANDYFDFSSGADNSDRTGPLRVLPSGLLRPQQVAAGAGVAFLLAFLIGLYLVAVGGWVILAIGLASIAAGLLYTGGPWPLGYHGWGDVLTFVFFGAIAVPGTYYLHSDTISGLPVALAAPIGFLVTAILVNNNIRDIYTDRRAGKYTLAVKMGVRFASWQYACIVLGSFAIPLLLWAAGLPATILLCALTLPLAIYLAVQMLSGPDKAVLEKMLGQTSLLLLLFGFLLTIGLII